MAVAFGEMSLARGYKISRYRRLEKSQDRAGLAAFLRQRFHERYVEPVSAVGASAFPKAGLSCMLLEALECFRRGEAETPERMSRAYFVSSLRAHGPFEELADYEDREHADFKKREEDAKRARRAGKAVPAEKNYTIYKGIRCGILHQGETVNGWRLRKDVPTFHLEFRILNAHWFQRETVRALGLYSRSLETADWESAVWRNFRNKMNATIEHAREASAGRGPEG